MTPYILWYCPYFSQFRERDMILVWSEAEKLSHIWTIEVTNTYLNMIGGQCCLLCSSKIINIDNEPIQKFPGTSLKGRRWRLWRCSFQTKNQIADKKHSLNFKVQSSKQDTFWDGRQGVSGLLGKYYLPITSWLDNDSSNKSFFQSIQVKYYHHTWKI